MFTVVGTKLVPDSSTMLTSEKKKKKWKCFLKKMIKNYHYCRKDFVTTVLILHWMSANIIKIAQFDKDNLSIVIWTQLE